jgi:hypothetical protein
LHKEQSLARNKSSRRRRDYDNNRNSKRNREERIERVTWLLLVLVFGLINILPEGTAIPNWLVPAAGAVILLGSGAYQYGQRMRVSPITWISGSLMLMLTIYSLYLDPGRDLLGFSMVVFAAVIGFGVLTGET